MDEFTVALWLFFAAIIFGVLGAWVAGHKRRSGGEGLALGCLLGPFGVIIEALLPTQAAPIARAAQIAAAEPTRKCPDCAETIKAEARVCRFCGARFSDEDVATAIASAREAQQVRYEEALSADPATCRYCGRDSRSNWHSARDRVCQDCIQRPDVRPHRHRNLPAAADVPDHYRAHCLGVRHLCYLAGGQAVFEVEAEHAAPSRTLPARSRFAQITR